MVQTKAINHRGPQQKRVLDGDVILLRKVDFRKMGAGVVEKIAQTALSPGIKEGDQVWFLDGYVAGEQPRDALIAAAIMEHTLGFAIAMTDSGDIIKEFGKTEAVRAEEVTHAATARLAVEVVLDEAEKAEAEDADEAEAPEDE